MGASVGADLVVESDPFLPKFYDSEVWIGDLVKNYQISKSRVIHLNYETFCEMLTRYYTRKVGKSQKVI